MPHKGILFILMNDAPKELYGIECIRHGLILPADHL